MSEVIKSDISSDSSFNSTVSTVINLEDTTEILPTVINFVDSIETLPTAVLDQRQLRGGWQYLLTTPVKKRRQKFESSAVPQPVVMSTPTPSTASSQDWQKMLDTMQQLATAMQTLAANQQNPVGIPVLSAPARPCGVMGQAQLPIFDGTGDPDRHIEIYENVARMEKWDDQQKCSSFYRTLRKSAEAWHIRNSEVLEQGTWEDMKTLFLNQYRVPNFEEDQHVQAVCRVQGENESV